MLKHNLLILYACTMALTTNAAFPKKLLVNVAVANLRAIPQAHDPNVVLPTSDVTNPLQITQVLLGEQLLAHEAFTDTAGNKWFKVNTLQQEYFDMPDGWRGYPGWIQADQTVDVDTFPAHNLVVRNQLADIFDQHLHSAQTVSIGTRLQGLWLSNNIWHIALPDQRIAYIDDQDVYCMDSIVDQPIEKLKADIIATALTFVGSYYSWGGRKSAQSFSFGLSSVDCSALVHLSFLAHGLQIPRMSHEQYLRSEKIEYGADLQPGDLIFFSSVTKNTTRMNHVMLYLGDDQILEATFAGEHKVRIISSEKRLGKSVQDLKSYDIVDDTDDEYHVYFGTFFNSTAMIQKLRDDALRFDY